MEELARLAAVDPLFLATTYREVALDDPEPAPPRPDWWQELTSKGGEGMVVKPLDFVVARRDGAAPARGEVSWARVPAYHLWARLHRAGAIWRGCEARPGRETRAGRCVSSRSASRAWSASSRREPLWRMHQAVFGVLALESEPVDPRL